MSRGAITEIGIDAAGRLYVETASLEFANIYRAGMGINWDGSLQRLVTPAPVEKSYAVWFDQLHSAVTGEYGIKLEVNSTTRFVDVMPDLKAHIVKCGT